MSFFSPIIVAINLCLTATLAVVAYLGLDKVLPTTLQSYLKFAYGSFLKPHTGDGSGNQQDALESFYQYQADAYDATRTRLLRGREDMLRLAAAQLKYRQSDIKPIWVDIGGGTGWNIEQMGKHINVPNFFSAVYLVDLTPSLLQVAKARFEKLGWSNVKVVCMDCRYFSLDKLEDTGADERQGADLVTMSYSLTMIPDFFPIIDTITSLLSPTGIVGVVDFYAQTEVEFMRRDYAGDFLDRHCSWLVRTFWRTWFEQDRVMFDGGRRDYLEYRFGTRISVNKRNAMVPGLRIPYYIWIGCSKEKISESLDEHSIQSSFMAAPEGLARPEVPWPSVYYQNREWRTYYLDAAQTFQKPLDTTHLHIVEDSLNSLPIGPDDTIIVPTTSANLILSLLHRRPQIIHVVDPDPATNHILELILAAAAQQLTENELQVVFGIGDSETFHAILLDKLSPSLSSHASQYFLNFGPKGWLSSNPNRPDLKYLLPLIRSLDFVDLAKEKSLCDRVRIHTTSINEVLGGAQPESVTLIVIDGDMTDAAATALSEKGYILLRNGGSVTEKAGFEAREYGAMRLYRKVSQ